MKLLQIKLILIVLVYLNGCAVFSNLHTDAELLRQQGMLDVAHIQGYQFGHGVGLTQQEAIDAALSELGQTVFVQVRSEISSLRQAAIKEEGKTPDYTSYFAASSHSFSNVEISGHSIDARIPARSGWYVRVKISQEDVVKLRQELQRTAPLIAYLEVLATQNTLHPGRQLKFAVRGLQEAQRLGVDDQRITGSDYGGLSYAAYFNMQIQAAINLLLPLPYIEDNQVRVALINKQNFAPIAGVWLAVGEQQVVTDKNGITAAVDLSILSQMDSFAILALGDQNALTATNISLDTLLIEQINLADITNPETTTVFVHLDPADAHVELNGYTQTVPTFFNVPAAKPVTLTVHESDQYQEKNYTLRTQGRRYVYVTDTLIERKYGQLTLDFVRPDNNFVISVQNQKGEDLAIGNSIDEAIEIGRYSVQINHVTNPEAYQTVTDGPILVRENQQVQRSYQRPLHRRPWTRGTAFMLNYGFGSKLGDDYLLPTAQATETKMQDFKQLNCSGGCPGQDFHLRKVSHIDLQALKLFSTASFLLSGTLGITEAEFKLDNQQEISLQGFGAGIGAGFWTSKLGSLSWISANYKAEYLHWDDKHRAVQQQNMDAYVLNTYPYVEVGILLGVVAAGIRVPDPNIAAPEFFIGLGKANIESGYKHAEAASATRGLHY